MAEIPVIIDRDQFSRFQESNFKITTTWSNNELTGDVNYQVFVIDSKIHFYREYKSDKNGEISKYQLVHSISIDDPRIKKSSAQFAFAPSPTITTDMMNEIGAYLVERIRSSYPPPYPNISFSVDKYGSIDRCCRGRIELDTPITLVNILSPSQAEYAINIKYIKETAGCTPAVGDEWVAGTVSSPSITDGTLPSNPEEVLELTITLPRNDGTIFFEVLYPCDDFRETFQFPYPYS